MEARGCGNVTLAGSAWPLDTAASARRAAVGDSRRQDPPVTKLALLTPLRERQLHDLVPRRSIGGLMHHVVHTGGVACPQQVEYRLRREVSGDEVHRHVGPAWQDRQQA